MNSTFDPLLNLNETQTYWHKINENDQDFASWEKLVSIAETANGGLTLHSSLQDLEQLAKVYDQFLSKFPYCYGYWKKYADWMLALYTADKAQDVYERAVLAIPNSVDIWTHFCSFKMEHYKDVHVVRGLFERGASAVGLDFLSHPFW